MTFIIGLVTERFALISSDTRLRVFDAETLELLGYRDGEPKLERRTGRWFAGHNAARRLFDADLPDDELTAKLLERAPGVRVAVEQSGRAPVACGFEIRRDPDGLRLRVADFMSATIERYLRHGLQVMSPAAEPETITRVQGVVSHTADSLLTSPSLEDAVQLLRRVYRRVRDLCGPDGSVSADMEVGALVLDENGQVQQEHFPPDLIGTPC